MVTKAGVMQQAVSTIVHTQHVDTVMYTSAEFSTHNCLDTDTYMHMHAHVYTSYEYN